MAYTKLDDQFHSHPKLQRAQAHANAVAGVYARALSYCGAGLTEGFVDGYWARSISGPKLLEKVAAVGLWRVVKKGDEVTVTERRDSGRRKRPDVTLVMPANGYFIKDYLKHNASRAEVEERRNSGTNARAGESADARANGALVVSPTSPGPSSVLQDVSAVSPRTGPLERLLEVLHDKDDGTKNVLLAMHRNLNLSEGDFEYARECATGPGVQSPTKVAVAELKKRAAART